ncbi:hypothetical protein Q7C_2066 [Methylophaga frappieri]|uniref:Uncharacterized protein n=1 Tax=Methylophaga frappieri (strain ATCC BAA-2434 / DSM 25690 / JAM7) TaxID=754477 RepID=I1YJW2_METFJ|nr:hypothetical protein Q7C_2066 [Methylophaga frappieri]
MCLEHPRLGKFFHLAAMADSINNQLPDNYACIALETDDF